MTDIITAPPAVPDLLGTAPADLIDRVVDRPVATLDQARKRAERVRAGLVSYHAMRQDIADAYACRDWIALDYGSWAAYVEGEFGTELRKLTRDERREAVRDLRTQGMSMPQIAGAVGASVGTVHADIKAANLSGAERLPERITGADGKQRPATMPARTETPAESARSDRDRPLSIGETAASLSEDKGGLGSGPMASLSGGAAPAPAPVLPVTEAGATPEPERPKPPAWDPAEREAHMADVRRRQDVEAAQRSARNVVTTIRAEVATIIAGCRHGESGLITRQMIADLRASIDLLERELDGEL